jgi:hypothetical protein
MVSGAMAPDYLYFILLSHTSHYGHSLRGMFLFSLPAGLVALWIFHRLFKRPLLALAPDALARRVTPEYLAYSFWPMSRFFWVAASVQIGVFTHVLWDDFTHEKGLFVTMAPDLKLYFGLHMPLYSLLQLASTVLGAALLGWAFWRWWRRSRPARHTVVPLLSATTRTLILIVCTAAMLAFSVPYGLSIAKHFRGDDWWSVFIVKTVIGSITAAFIELIVFSVAWHLRKEKAPEVEFEG